MTELDKLEKYLKEKGIRYERIEINEFGPYLERHQIAVPSRGRGYKWDAICQRGSFGYEEGLLEIYGNLVNWEEDGDVVVGWLTAQDVIDRIEKPKQAESGFIQQEKSKNESVKTTDDLISRQDAIDAVDNYISTFDAIDANFLDGLKTAKKLMMQLPFAQPTQSNDSNTLNALDCISRQQAIEAASYGCGELRGVFERIEERLLALPSAQPEIIRCKECKHFEYDHPYIIQGVPVLGHEVCNAWGDGCKTDENGYCFLAERRTDE